MKEEQRLFSGFRPVSTEEWIEKITRDLKGADFRKKMVWKTNEGFEVMPFYRSENLEGLAHAGTSPGEFPYVRGTRTGSNAWFVRQTIEVSDYAAANRKALDILMRGVDSLGFSISNPDTLSASNIERLLEGIHAGSIEINFSTAGRARELLGYFIEALKKSKADLKAVTGGVEADPLGRLMVNGKLCVTAEEGLDYLAALMGDAAELTRFRVLGVNGAAFCNAGADIVTELAFTLSLGNEYLARLTSRGIDIGTAAAKTGFIFGTGSNYFMEIAKLRAARMLWALIVKKYNPSSDEVCRMYIHSVTGEWNKTAYDPYVNMLRTQTEAMSATLGGADSLLVQPFDGIFARPDEFSERIARNQQLLLKEEAHFDKVADPAAGSWYIENLTAMIADAAWKLFIETEERGGFLKALRDGYIQQKVEEIASKRVSDIRKRREVLLGTNQYPSFGESLPSRADESKMFSSAGVPDGTEVKPLRLFRGAEEFERLRLASERSGLKPSVFLLTTGNPAMRLARAQFTSNFFACGGYRVIDKGPYKTAAAGAEAALASGAQIVVICSSDEEYAAAAPEAFAIIGGRAHFVVAGAPECGEELKKAGINHFISIRSDVYETLRQFHSLLGITV